MTIPGRRRLLAIALVIVAVGLAVRVGYVLTLAGRPLEADELDYIESAKGLLGGNGFDATVYYHVPPLPPLLLAAAFAVTGPGLTPAMLLQCAMFIPAAWVAFLLGREVAGGELGGLVTLAMVSFYPYFIFFAGQIGTEAPAFVLIPATVLAGLRAVRNPTIGNACWVGLLIAAATLTRAAVLYYLALVPVAFVAAWGLRDRRWIRGSAAVLLAFLALYLPWCAVNRHYFGEWIASPTIGSGVMLYQTALRLTIPDPAERAQYLRQEILPKYYYPSGATHAQRLAGDRHMATEGKRLIGENISRMPRLVWENLTRFWQFYPNYGEPGARRFVYRIAGLASYGLLFPLLATGLVVGLARFRQLSCLYLFVGYFSAVHTVLFGKLRYRIPMDPLLLALAAMGLLAALAAVTPDRLRAAERLLGCNDGTLARRPQ